MCVCPLFPLNPATPGAPYTPTEYGIMMVQYRPVDCDSKRPIKFDPGYISDVIYDVSGVW